MAMNRQRRTSNISNIFSYDDAGNIVIKDYSQVIRYSWNGTIHGFIGPVSVSSVAAATTDTDKFLVSDGGVLKFRTGAEVLSDIGGQPVITNPVTGTGVAGQVAYWSGTNSQTGSNNLFWDAANARLGIGTNAPSTTLDIRGKTRIQSSGNAELDIIDGANQLRLAMGSSQGFVGTLTSHPFGFFTAASKRGEFSTNGNFILQNGGTFSDGGQRLQVYGDAFIKGSGFGSASALTIQDNGGTNLFRFRNDGLFAIGNSADRPFIFPFTIGSGSPNTLGTNLSFFNYTSTQLATQGNFSFENTASAQTSGVNSFIRLSNLFAPTSGTATQALLFIQNTINQTGGANGITRGLYVNPTLTAAADWRSIEWSNNTGFGLYGSGTSANYLGGNLLIKTTTDTGYSAQITSATGDSMLNVWGATAPSIRLDNAASGASQRFVIGLATATNNFIQGASAGSVCITTASASPMVFGMWQTSTASEVMRITTSNNLLIGTSTDAGYKLQVSSTIYTINGGIYSDLNSTINQALYATNQSLTGAASNGMIYLESTWNTTGNPSAIYLNVTNTASGAFSKLLDLRVGATPVFQVDKAGGVLTGQPTGGSQGVWKFGQYNATAPTATGYVEVEVNGTLYKLLAST